MPPIDPTACHPSISEVRAHPMVLAAERNVTKATERAATELLRHNIKLKLHSLKDELVQWEALLDANPIVKSTGELEAEATWKEMTGEDLSEDPTAQFTPESTVEMVRVLAPAATAYSGDAEPLIERVGYTMKPGHTDPADWPQPVPPKVKAEVVAKVAEMVDNLLADDDEMEADEDAPEDTIPEPDDVAPVPEHITPVAVKLAYLSLPDHIRPPKPGHVSYAVSKKGACTIHLTQGIRSLVDHGDSDVAEIVYEVSQTQDAFSDAQAYAAQAWHEKLLGDVILSQEQGKEHVVLWQARFSS